MNSLKEKFLQYTPVEFEEEYTEKCEKIADDYAIEFYNWCNVNIQDINYAQINATEQLLEIFKKEKGYDTNN